MNTTIKIILTSCCFLLLLPNMDAQERTKRVNKKIEKAIGQLWKGSAVAEIPIETHKSLEFDLFFEENQLRLLRSEGEQLGYLLLRRGYGCQIGGCGTGSYEEGATCSADGGTYETFDYALFFDNDLNVLKVIVVDYPGEYGYEINSKGWLKQFIGYSGETLRYSDDIDAISGATISATSMTSDIQEVHEMLNHLLNYDDQQMLTKKL